MSIPNLPVDFKDDILSSTNKKRKYKFTGENVPIFREKNS